MKITNETLKKLTNKEAQDLNLFSLGCVFLRGEAKQRVKGYKTTLKTETEVHYSCEGHTVELVKLASESYFMGKKMQDWCLRVSYPETDEYDLFVQPLFGTRFVK